MPTFKDVKEKKEAINGDGRGIVREIERGHRILVKSHSSVRSRIGFTGLCSETYTWL